MGLLLGAWRCGATWEGAQFSVTEVNREGRAPARPRALSIAASKFFRIIISEAIVTEVGEISLRKMEMVGRVQAGRTGRSWKDEKRWGGFSAPRAEGGAGTSRAGPVCGEHLWERGLRRLRDGGGFSGFFISTIDREAGPIIYSW